MSWRRSCDRKTKSFTKCDKSSLDQLRISFISFFAHTTKHILKKKNGWCRNTSQRGKLNSDALQETVLRWKSFGIPECDVEVHATDSGQFLPTLLGTESVLLVRVFLGQWKWENCIYNWLLIVICVILRVSWTCRSHQDMEVFIVFCLNFVPLECCFLW